jgi:two-component system, NtrC family, sensor kinase
LLRQKIDALFPDGQNQLKNEQLQEILGGRIIQDLELTLKNKEGGTLTALLSASALQDNDGKTVGIICAFRDITERKKLETRMLQSEKLSAVGQLAAGVAHEINNPLGIILGFAQSIKSQAKPDDPSRTGLDFIEKETIRCKDLVQNLLVFSRASRTEQREQIDINTTIEGALSLVNAQSRVKNIELVKEFAPNLPQLQANRNQIQQVLINLCNNAMDAMSKSGQIVVRTGEKFRNGQNWITFQVQDTGSGIPKDIQSKIFEPFFTTKEVGKGTGLGLSLIFEIIQKHNGTVELTSEVGVGTTFTVYLPILAEEQQKAA